MININFKNVDYHVILFQLLLVITFHQYTKLFKKSALFVNNCGLVIISISPSWYYDQ